VSTAEHAASVSTLADGVIIGSRLIRLIDEGDTNTAPARVSAFLGDVRRALDNSQETKRHSF
jgi:tryptophan synthase alpha subunit